MTQSAFSSGQANTLLPRRNERILKIARVLALVVMTYCLVVFVWSLILFPATADTNLDVIRPWSDWTDDVLRAVIAESGFTIAALAYIKLAYILFPTLFYLIVAAIIFMRRADDWFSLYLSVLFVIFGTVANTLSRTVGSFHPALAVIQYGLGNAGWLGLFPAFYLFPNGKFVPRWAWVMFVLWATFVAFLLFDTLGFAKRIEQMASDSLSNVIGIPLVLFLFIGAVASQVYRYFWQSDAIQRQQTKWVLGAIILFVASVIYSFGNQALNPPAQRFTVEFLHMNLFSGFVFALTGAFFPISIGIAILRYRLWDIDVIIRRTVTYSILTALLLAVYFGIVIVTQQLFRTVTGQNSEIAIIVSTLAIAILFVPLRRRIQDFLDRRFYRRKYDAQQVLAQFAVTARDETDIDKLTSELMRVVDETMQPENVTLWLKKTGQEKGR